MKKNILLLSCSFLVIFLICEGFVRLFFPQINEHDQMFEKDPILGWKFIPEHSVTIVYDDEVNHEVTINSDGYRDNAFSEKKGTRKIMVVGDSFVSNISVGEQDVFTSVLEESLSNTSVFNLGVNGYGQVQEFLMLQKWLPEIQPDIVVLMIYLRNDFTDNLGTTQWLYPRPTAALDAHKSVVIQSPSASNSGIEKSLPWYYNSHLFRFVKTRMGVLMSQQDQESPSQFIPPEYYICRTPISEETQTMYTVLEQMLLKINSFAEKNNTPVVFALAPSIVQVEDELWNSMEASAKKEQINVSRDFPNTQLMAFAEAHGLSMVDLLPDLQKAQQGGIETYHTKEQHWTVAGNETVANTLKNYLDTISN